MLIQRKSRRTASVSPVLVALASLATSFGGEIQAETLSFGFSDPVGDHTGRIDVVGMVFTFDSSTGAYQIQLTADAANPFIGRFRINLHLFNPDTGTTARNRSLFSDALNNFNLTTPTTVLTLEGVSSNLRAWKVGDRVATSNIPHGGPAGSSTFRSSVLDVPARGFGTSEDIIAAIFRPGRSRGGDVATVVSGPGALMPSGPKRPTSACGPDIDYVTFVVP